MSRLRLLFDNFTLILIAIVVAATLFPAHGQGAFIFERITSLAIALLFFLHGAKLSRPAIVAGATHWRLHLMVFASTFIMFPCIAYALKPVLEPLLGEPLYVGVIYLCVLPGTVQSAIAFTAIARGNIPAAVCSASASSLIGIGLTPLLLSLFLKTDAGAASTVDAIANISVQILLPFLAGHFLRPWIGNWVDRNRFRLANVDQTSILLVVYTAFSASVTGGLWQTVPVTSLLILTVVCCALLALVLYATTSLARHFQFNTEDEITIVFCGSKKSMATGVPMAQVLFNSSAIGPALLPLIIFHQIQLMVCVVLAQNYLRRRASATSAA
ncbi:bile acid:sodium symporter family protein [Allopusillimonas ginsengisoli]|uniref:bile acid:sodium symporter family protein n=1 Tax=Allopusillimonas ginsengisoli TaxID=453575 RepID=UPI00101FF3B4|nr:bile acid:sodium symporter family protein [Allopusillimonas ginsengisoli]TEA77718.1 bile acid:sodium symporter [Allopusillimonas ginsengisoli]